MESEKVVRRKVKEKRKRKLGKNKREEETTQGGEDEGEKMAKNGES